MSIISAGAAGNAVTYGYSKRRRSKRWCVIPQKPIIRRSLACFGKPGRMCRTSLGTSSGGLAAYLNSTPTGSPKSPTATSWEATPRP